MSLYRGQFGRMVSSGYCFRDHRAYSILHFHLTHSHTTKKALKRLSGRVCWDDVVSGELQLVVYSLLSNVDT